MITFSFSLLLIGALLGIRFQVFVLVPAIACALGCVLAVKIVCGETLSLALIQAALATTVLQVGYFCGMLLGSTAARGHFFPRQNISFPYRSDH